MQAIHARRQDELAAARDRAARRARLLAEQAAACTDADARDDEDAALAALVGCSAKEQAAAAQLWQLRQEKAR
jgi:hypothetical protein